MSRGDEVLFRAGEVQAGRFDRTNLTPAQRFMEASPAYAELINGASARPDEAELELTELPPQIDRKDAYFLGFWECSTLVGIAHVMRTWPVRGISHVGLFQIAEQRQATGLAAPLFHALEEWMIREFDPRWLRLGVVAANERGRRFWQRMGFHETGRKRDVTIGVRNHELIVMVKAVRGERDEEYWRLAAESPVPLETPVTQPA